MVQEAKADSTIGKEIGMLSVPTGHLEIGELPEERLIKELKEETGYQNIKIEGLLGIYLIKKALGILYQVQLSGEKKKRLKNEISKVSWMTPKEILLHQDSLRPAIKEIIEDYLSGRVIAPLDLVRICF